jgi:hypothetical protein
MLRAAPKRRSGRKEHALCAQMLFGFGYKRTGLLQVFDFPFEETFECRALLASKRAVAEVLAHLTGVGADGRLPLGSRPTWRAT